MSSVLDDWWPVLERHWLVAQAKGMLGPGPLAAHRAHAMGLAAFVDCSAGGVDLGTGAGVPGILLAGLAPASRWLLVDASQRRVELVQAIVDDLGVGERVAIIHDRAEEVARGPGRGTHGLVVARSFGPPAVVAECAVGFLRPGGHLVVSEPPDEPTETRWPASGCAALGLALGAVATGSVAAVRLDLARPVADRWPRRAGMPAKRPLW
jgi:16S rRNA (guanine527-N7)-methyltransferase